MDKSCQKNGKKIPNLEIPILFTGAKSDVTSTNATKLSADRIQFQLTLHEEEEEASGDTFDPTIVSGHNQEDHTVVWSVKNSPDDWVNSFNQSYTSWNQLCKTIVILNLSAREKTHLNVAVSKKKVQMIWI